MTGSLPTLVAIGALSLAVWTVFYLLMPSTPLTAEETVIIVGVCAAIVLGAKWLWGRLRARDGGAGKA
jgi:hypothetical protein